MARLGREFERMVARIEETLCPVGAQIKSPDKIKDRVTGIDREVDASIRYTIGSAPILITVECRDRGSVQDITWLEQVKAKKDGMAANQTIVVSKEGFSKAAILYANQHGLILRQLSEVTEAFWLQCLQGLKVGVQSTNYKLMAAKFAFYMQEADDETSLRLSDAVSEAIAQDKPFTQNRQGESVILRQLYQEEVLPDMKAFLADHENKLGAEFSMEQRSQDIEMIAEFGEQDLLVESTLGPRYLKAIIFIVRYEVEFELLPPLRQMKYVDETGKVIDSFAVTGDGHKTGIRIKTGWDEILKGP